MAVVTTIEKVQSISQDDAFIQSLVDTDPVVVNTFDLVDKMVSASKFGSKLESAQRYLSAHLLSLAKTDAGGRGPLSSESIGGITKSYTLPYLNQVTVLASTQYGLMYLELRRSSICNVLVV